MKVGSTEGDDCARKKYRPGGSSGWTTVDDLVSLLTSGHCDALTRILAASSSAAILARNVSRSRSTS
jgi:hypothetical protein